MLAPLGYRSGVAVCFFMEAYTLGTILLSVLLLKNIYILFKGTLKIIRAC